MQTHSNSSSNTREPAGSRDLASSKRSRRLVVGLTIAGCALASFSFLQSRPSLVWNFSPSLPEGLYRLDDRPWRKSDLVAYRPSGAVREWLDGRSVLPRGHMLLKRVAASAGDIVCRDGDSISVNDVYVATARQQGGDGRPLPAWSGCIRLPAEEIFLLADHPASFDGRYFGPVPASGVVGVISPLVIASDRGGTP